MSCCTLQNVFELRIRGCVVFLMKFLRMHNLLKAILAFGLRICHLFWWLFFLKATICFIRLFFARWLWWDLCASYKASEHKARNVMLNFNLHILWPLPYNKYSSIDHVCTVQTQETCSRNTNSFTLHILQKIQASIYIRAVWSGSQLFTSLNACTFCHFYQKYRTDMHQISQNYHQILVLNSSDGLVLILGHPFHSLG